VNVGAFDLRPGVVLGGKYEVIEKLGGGYEGEVYRVVETRTGANRAAKLFFPKRNLRDRTVRFYAKKLERLRRCNLVVDYHHVEDYHHQGHRVSVLISEYIGGRLLANVLRDRPGRRLETYEALCLLHQLARGVVEIHEAHEYHGDLHSENILVSRKGIRWEVRMLDFWNWGRPTRANLQEDVVNLARILHEMIGGAKTYARQGPEIKAICRGLRPTLILERFPTASHLVRHLETFEWSRA
jgi:serine/threonine protein kinase